MRGSTFVVFEVLLWMAAALFLGMIIGWLIRGWRSDAKLREAVERAHAEDLADRGELSARLAVAEARLAEEDAADRVGSIAASPGSDADIPLRDEARQEIDEVVADAADGDAGVADHVESDDREDGVADDD